MFEPIFNTWACDEAGKVTKKRTMTKHGKPLGRQREIDATGALGLVLHWYRTRGPVFRDIATAFGLTATPMFKWLKFSRRCLKYAIQDHPNTKVVTPSDKEVEEYAAAISTKYPILGPKKIWGAIDGLRVPLQPTASYNERDHYYHESTSSTSIKNMFLFSPDGQIQSVY